MLKLMKLELRKNNIKPYIKSSVISFFVVLGFTYFVALVSRVENDPTFQNYDNIFLFSSFICVIYFSILSAVMLSRYVIDSYKGKKVALLFSYPVSRKNVFLSKVLIVLIFNVVSMIISYTLSILVFGISESIYSIVLSDLTIRSLFLGMINIVPLAFTIGGIGIIAMWFGFRKKSIQTTIVSSFILVALFGNIGTRTSDPLTIIMIQTVIIIVGIILLSNIVKQINQMEVK